MKTPNYLKQPIFHRLDQSEAMILVMASEMVLMLLHGIPFHVALKEHGVKKSNREYFTNKLRESNLKMRKIMETGYGEDDDGVEKRFSKN